MRAFVVIEVFSIRYLLDFFKYRCASSLGIWRVAEERKEFCFLKRRTLQTLLSAHHVNLSHTKI